MRMKVAQLVNNKIFVGTLGTIPNRVTGNIIIFSHCEIGARGRRIDSFRPLLSTVYF